MRHGRSFPKCQIMYSNKASPRSVVRRERYQNEHIQAVQHELSIYAQAFLRQRREKTPLGDAEYIGLGVRRTARKEIFVSRGSVKYR